MKKLERNKVMWERRFDLLRMYCSMGSQRFRNIPRSELTGFFEVSQWTLRGDLRWVKDAAKTNIAPLEMTWHGYDDVEITWDWENAVTHRNNMVINDMIYKMLPAYRRRELRQANNDAVWRRSA